MMTKCQCSACECAGEASVGDDVCRDCDEGVHRGRVTPVNLRRFAAVSSKPVSKLKATVAAVPLCDTCGLPMRWVENWTFGRGRGVFTAPAWRCCKNTLRA